MRISALRHPCFYVRPQYTRRGTKSQARRHIPAAAAFGCSKSTVHKDVAVRLRSISPALYGQVRAVLARNKAERHLRGGAATRRRYSRR